MAKETFTKEEVLKIMEYYSEAIWHGVNRQEYILPPERILENWIEEFYFDEYMNL